MSDAALQQLSDAQGALIAALDAQDIEAIDSANAALAQAVQSVRAVGGASATVMGSLGRGARFDCRKRFEQVLRREVFVIHSDG